MAGVARSSVFLAFALSVACGGRSVQSPGRDEAPPENTGGNDAGQPEDVCVCPPPTPAPGDECGCPGLECSFPWSFCRHGDAICSPERQWLRQNPQNMQCPAELPPNGGVALCTGEGTCEYAVDVGCGPAVLEVSCVCVDATWYLSRYDAPPLCRCAAIALEALCGVYSGECTWSEEFQRCESAL
ncbi:MAG TPA: hypothetical protein VFZ53_14700 [Polyangiaceae bacterium]